MATNQPPVDTPVFTVAGRLSEIWRMWFTSLTSAANAVAGALLAANNLSDLTNTATARSNLGLGSAATHNVSDFDPAGAASAVAATVPTKVSQLSNDANFITAAGAPVQSVAGRTGAVTLSTSDVAGLGSAALQPASAFDPAGAWSSWTGDVAANSHNLSGVYILGTAGLQVSAFATISGSLNYTDGAATYMTSNNAGSGAWNEFSYYLNKGAALANDEFWVSVNARTSSGGSDSWAPALRIKALTGAVTLPNQTTFSVAPVFSDQAGTRSALGLGSAATANTTAFDAAGAASSAQAASLPTYLAQSAASVASGTASTLYTFPSSTIAVYSVSASIGPSGDPTHYAAWAIVAIDTGAAKILTSVQGGLLTISLSGMALQVTQSSGVAQPLRASILRIG